MTRKILFIYLWSLLMTSYLISSEESLTTIAIGSTNRIKIQAVKNALSDEKSQVISYPASSNVRSQPLSDEETLLGAINRAKDCLAHTDAALAIGLEGGIVFMHEKIYMSHWGAIVDKNQNTYFTNGPLILLPESFRQPLLEGIDLETIMHESTGIDQLGKKEGAIGIFTKGRINREEMLTQIVKVLLGEYSYYQRDFSIGQSL